MWLSRHILLIVLVPAILLAAFFSYYRFMLKHDYLVTYENECDPETESCFIGCEDEACADEYYYSLIEKHASIVYEQCGSDITDCEAAYSCEEGEPMCTVMHCDPELDGDACELDTVSTVDENSTEDMQLNETEPEETLEEFEAQGSGNATM